MTLRNLHRQLVDTNTPLYLLLLLVAIGSLFFAGVGLGFISLVGVVDVKDFVLLSSILIPVSLVFVSNKSVMHIWHNGGVI